MANMTSPLSDMLQEEIKEPLTWSNDCTENFHMLKECRISPPILKIPDLTKPFYLRTGANNAGLGAVMLQYLKNIPQPVSYASRKLFSREKNYSSIEKEYLAIIWAVDKFRYYLYEKEFLI